MSDGEMLGTTQVRGCCTFLWTEEREGLRRQVAVRPYHCAACVEELQRTGRRLGVILVAGGSEEMLRRLLARERVALVARWMEQLAVGRVGETGDGAATVRILPLLLDAVDAVLASATPPAHRLPPLPPSRMAEALSMLLDFVIDFARAASPGLREMQLQALSSALARSALGLLAPSAQRPPDRARLMRLDHELRNAATAAQLRAGLSRGMELPNRRLREGLGRLRGLLDAEILDALGPDRAHTSKAAIAPLLTGAAEACSAEVRRRSLRVELELPHKASLRADPLLAGPLLHELLRASLHACRAGGVVRLRAAEIPGGARVSMLLDRPRRSLASPQLSLVRRAVRAQGGSLRARRIPGDGAVLTLELPDKRSR